MNTDFEVKGKQGKRYKKIITIGIPNKLLTKKIAFSVLHRIQLTPHSYTRQRTDRQLCLFAI